MLLQTNSYVVPKDKRAEHARLLNRFRQTLARFGCEHFEVFEQAGSNWGAGEPSGRYVQMIRFRDKKHHMQVQAAERSDPSAQKLIAEFCELINFPYQQQQGLFAVGFYNGVLPISGGGRRTTPAASTVTTAAAATAAAAPAVVASLIATHPQDVPDANEPASPLQATTGHEAEAAIEADFTESDDQPTTPSMRLAQSTDAEDDVDSDAATAPEPLDLEIDLEIEPEPTTDVDLTADEVDLLEPDAEDEPRGRR